jgi:glycosyltransferase involved in cell wall biosynthesis
VITLVATILNEGESLHGLMRSLVAQTRPPEEVVFVDGGSSDNTVSILQSNAAKLPLRVLVEPGCNISAGRNRAIAAAQGDIIAVTDAGVRLDEHWLERLTQPLIDDLKLQVVGGFFHADPHNAFEVALGAATLPLESEIDAATFLPSSRSVAFRKAAWERVGGYPEWLDYCEDLIFDLRLKKTLPPFGFAPDALVYFRPRPTLVAFYRQYYRYARGDGKADLWRKRHAARYLTYLVAAPAIFLLGLLVHPLLWLLYIVGAAIYLAQPYRRLPTVLKQQPTLTITDKLAMAGLIPLIRVVGDAAKMIGYPVGVYWRLRHHPPDWRQV